MTTLRLTWTGMTGIRMQAILGDYELYVDTTCEHTRWYILPRCRQGAIDLGLEDDEAAAQVAAEAALFERLEAYRPMLDEERARLRRIEAAAREVLASGRARYETEGYAGDRDWQDARNLALIPEDNRYVGDLVPAAAMQALRAAVEGGAQGLQADVPLMMQEATDG